MPALYDSASGRATTRRGARKAAPKRKAPLIAPQIRATRRPSSSRAATHVPGVGAVARPTPRMQNAARTVAKAKPRAPRKPTAAEQAATRSRQRVRSKQAEVERKAEPARRKSEARQREAGPFARKPVASFLAAERGAISNLASLHRQNPKEYETKLAKAKIGEGRPIAGPRGQTVERFKGKTVAESLSDMKVKKLPKAKTRVVAGPRGQTKPKVVKANTVGEVAATAIQNAPKNFGDIVQYAPTSIAHSAKTAVTDPKRAVKETVQPYIDIVKNPTKELAERPLTTALTVTPLGRAPGLIAGKAVRVKAARKAHKAGTTASNERPQSELPGTALRERRAGSRSAGKRWAQRREDRKTKPVKVTQRDTERRVDEFWNYAQQHVMRARDKAAKAAKQAGLTPQHIEAAIEDAGQRAKHENDKRFAREFGANQRPSTGQRERLEAAAERETTRQSVRTAVGADKAARAEVEAALAEARARRGEPTDRLTALEAERAAAHKALVEHQTAQTRARLEHAKAEGAARVSQAKATSPKLSELTRQRKQAARALTAAQAALNKAKGKGEKVSGGAGAAERALTELEAATAQLAHAREAVKGKRGTARAVAMKAVTKAQARVAHAQGRVKETRGQRPARVESTETIARAQKAVDDAKVAFNEAAAAVRAEAARVSGVAPREADRMRSAIAGLDEAGARVRAQREAIRDLGERIATERARTRGVHPEAANRLVNALVGRDEAREALLARQGEHSTAKQRHQAVKHAAANSVLSDAAKEGRIFEHAYDAQKVKQQLNDAGHEIQVGSSTGPARSPVRYVMTPQGVRLRRSGEARQPVKFKVVKVGDEYAVVPEIASHRRYLHDVVGTSKATNAMLLRDTRKGLTTATLPFSLKWLGGQAGEAGLRSAISGAGGLDYARLKLVVKRMNEISPGAGDEFLMRLPGTNFDVTGEARRSMGETTLAERYQGRWPNQTTSALTWMGQSLPGRGAKGLVRGWNRVVLGKINNAIERTAITAMAGHAIKRDFMNERTLGLTATAIDEAARGLMNTPNQIAAARAVIDDYGKYSNFSPELRNAIMHWTPYLPWYLNTVRFLINTVKNHPIKASLIGAMTAATEDWRAEHELSAYGDEQVPEWQRGSYPFFGDQLSRVGQFTPFGSFADPAGSLGGLGLPQALGTVAAGLGVDFTGRQLRDASTGLPFNWKQKIAKGAVSGLEAQVPALGLGMRLSGLGPRYIDRKDPASIAPFKTRLARELPLWPLGDVSGGGGGGVDVEIPDVDVPDIDVPEVDVPDF